MNKFHLIAVIFGFFAGWCFGAGDVPMMAMDLLICFMSVLCSMIK